MKGMPLPCEFQGKGVVDFSEISPDLFPFKWISVVKEGCFVGSEPTSVLDTTRSPSPPTSSSTSLNGGGGGNSSGGGGATGGGGSGGTSTGMTSVAAAVPGTQSQKWPPQPQDSSSDCNVGVESGTHRKDEWGAAELQPIPTSLDIGVGGGGDGVSAAAVSEKCGLGMDEWVSILSEPATSPSQEQSIFRWIMGDVEADSSMGLNKLLQSGCGSSDFEFSGGFGMVDQGLGPESSVGMGANLMGIAGPLPFQGVATTAAATAAATATMSTPPNLMGNLLPMSLHQQQQMESAEEKPQVYNPQMLINQHQLQSPPNPAFFLPLSSPHHHQQEQQQHLLSPPQPKRHNSGGPNSSMMAKQPPFLDSGQAAQELFLRRQQQQQLHGFPQQLQLLPHHSLQQQRPAVAAANSKPKMMTMMGGEEALAQNQHLQQAVIDQLYKAAELLETGNLVLAQGILARLNHQLSPVGKPFLRAAFYFKEALQLLLHMNTNSFPPHPSPFTLIYKIGAYKSFSEISPILQFANFTCIQALLEALQGFDRIHIVDFDFGYGGQWASLMQELALRNGSTPSLKITAFISPTIHDELELSLARENLNHFSNEISMSFQLEIVYLETLNSASWSLPVLVSDDEAVAVNLPVGSSSNYSLPLPMVLRFIKQLSPKIVVSLDRGHDRSDLSFPQHIIHALQSHWTLLESLDAVNVNLDALQKIERFLLHPDIEKIVLGRHRSREKTPPWRTLFLSCGFSPLTFSNFNESQAECVVKRSPVRGFHVEKRHSSLVLCWQRKELISASAWRC